MNNNEAKFVLDAYRPGGHDATDPAFAEALAQAKADPALAAWFAHEQAHAAGVAAKLRSIAPPPELRDAVLAGCRATERATPPARARMWRPLPWMALAAAVVLLAAGTALFWPRAAAGADELTRFAFNDVRFGRHGGHGAPAAALVAELSAPTAHLMNGLPIDFVRLRHTGCRTLRVGGHDVLEVCFTRNGAEFHCYIAHAADFAPQPVGGPPELAQSADLSAAAWTRGAYRYVVVGAASLEAVRRLL